MAAPKLKRYPVDNKEQNAHDKKLIAEYQKKIKELLKDPKNAKKAAMFIEDLLSSNKKN
jgi:hypothetical protein